MDGSPLSIVRVLLKNGNGRSSLGDDLADCIHNLHVADLMVVYSRDIHFSIILSDNNAVIACDASIGSSVHQRAASLFPLGGGHGCLIRNVYFSCVTLKRVLLYRRHHHSCCYGRTLCPVACQNVSTL